MEGKRIENARAGAAEKSRLSIKPDIIGVFLALLLAFPLFAEAEFAAWICPDCGQTGNTGNYCPNCAAARPAQEEEEIEENPNLTAIPGETDRVAVDVVRIDGSGFVPGKADKYFYAPENVLDGDDATCWKFPAKNASEDKVWLSLIVDGETVDELWIKNGYQAVSKKGNDQYPLYARAKEIEVVFIYEEAESDRMHFTLLDERNGWQKLSLGRREQVYEILIYIQSLYQGSHRADTACLSEVMPVQRAPSESAKESRY